MDDATRRELMLERTAVSGMVFSMPDAHAFSDVLELVSPWDHERFNHRSGVAPPDRPRSRVVSVPSMNDDHATHVDVGPFCIIDRIGSRYPVAVWPTDATIDAIAPHLLGEEGAYSFEVIEHDVDGQRVALVTAHASQILGDVWLAYIDAETIPAVEVPA